MTLARDRDVGRDAEARRLAQTEYEKPLVIEAGAGTGKTGLLVARVVVWCLGPGWAKHAEGREPAAVARKVVERVVAITFTDAAAAEMAERVATAFSMLAKGDPPVGVNRELIEVDDGELAARASLLADEIHRLRAQTIHSWCHHLLRAFPLEAGVHPRFEVDSDGTRVDEVVTDVLAESLRALVEGGTGSDWEILATAGVTPAEVSDAVRRFIAAGVSGDHLRDDPCSPGAVRALVLELIEAVDSMDPAGLTSLAGTRGTTGLVAPALEELRRDLGAVDPENPQTVADALSKLPDKVRKRVKDWAKGNFTKTDAGIVSSRESLTESSAALHDLLAGLKGFSPNQLSAAVRLLAHIVDTVNDRLVRSGVLGFDALLRLAAGMLESSDGVCDEVRAGIDQLMVDEFQDTDATQCRMVRMLAVTGEEPRPGLFIVGDPKQSIYGWRRADLAAYDRFIAEVAEADGLVRPLVRNFRSTQGILDEVERLVGPVMVQKEGVQPAFQQLVAADDHRIEPGFTHRHWVPVENWVCRPPSEEGGSLEADVNVVDAIDIEAAAVAEDIRRLVSEAGVEPKEVAVLVRSTTSLEPLLVALRSTGVPFEVARDRQYYQQREVMEAAALVRTVIEPADQLALLTVLRSDAVGIPDAALAPLWDAGLPGVMARIDTWEGHVLAELDACIDHAASAVPKGLPGMDEVRRWPLALGVAARVVGQLRAAVAELPPDVFVELVRTMWLNEVTASARFQGRYRRARLERFFAELAAALASDDGSLAAVARMLRRAVDEGQEPRVPGDPDVAAHAVHVMTIHSAKGLGFEHVYLCQIQRGDPGTFAGSAVELRPMSDGLEYRLFGWPTLGFGVADRLRLERERAERVRLLYVAATRARKRLVVSGRWRIDGKRISVGEARSFEDLVARRLPVEDVAEQAAQRAWRRSEGDRPVQWVLPVLDPDRAEVGGGDAEDRPPYDLGRVRREAGRLATHRAAAAARSALPLAAAASSLAHGLVSETGDEGDPGSAAAAAAAGTAVHRLLETLDLDGDLRVLVSSKRTEVVEWAEAESRGGRASERVGEILDKLVDGRCLERLGEIRRDVVARELPVLAEAVDGDPAVSAILGVVDLVYRTDGGLVVADYKTDAVVTEDGLAERAEHYRPQLDLYARAVRGALNLDYTPATELWFLSADRIITL